MCRTQKPDIDALYANQQPAVRFTQNFLSTTVRGQDEGDYLSCPLGVLFLLTTLLGSGGARGKTARQIGDTLKLTNTIQSDDIKSLRESAKSMYWTLVDPLTKAETVIDNRNLPVVTISNGVFLQQRYDIKSDFIFSLSGEYRAMVEKVNFKDQIQTMMRINDWIRNKTRDMIPTFLKSKDEIPSDTKMALFNVLTFKDEWQEKFLTFSTKTDDFWFEKGKSVKVQMMSGVQSLPYAKFSDKGFSLVEKPMKGERFSLVIILPNQKWDLREANKVLNGFYLLKDFVSQARITGVSIQLPRFEIASELDLIPYLRSMGINDLFNQGVADLSGITESDQLFVSLMKQGTVLKVNEAGVEAVAVTGMVAVPTSILIADVEFHANHPFVCFIYDRQLNMPLFAARVTRPRNP